MHLFFDLDGTLLDHRYAASCALSAMLRGYDQNLVANLNDHRRLWEFVVDRCMVGKQSWFFESIGPRIVQMFAEHLGRRLPPDDSQVLFETYLRAYKNSWRLLPDVEECLLSLKAWPKGVITNGSVSLQTHKLRALGLAGVFSPVIVAESVGASKPSTAMFDEALVKAGLSRVDRGSCIYVGDDYDLDIAPALQSGWQAVLLTRDSQPVREVITISSLSQLQELLSTSFAGRPPTIGVNSLR